jgi:flagellar M-ring protein FliF
MRTRVTVPLQRLVTAFQSFSAGQKTMAVLAVVALIAGGIVFTQWLSRPSLEPLFSNLSAGDASAIVEKLQADGVTYELADGGHTVMVPREQVYDLRLSMSGAGLPTEKEDGYSLLDKQGVTTSEFQQHVNYKRALEGELASTVESVEGVRSAVVHLALPEKSVFAEEEQKPTAALLVDLAPSTELKAEQVTAMVNLIASSVPELEPSAVTVADATGRVLSSPGTPTSAGGGSAQSQATTDYQDRMAGSLQQMLDRLVGPGKAVAQVTADLDFDQTSTKSEKFAAGEDVPPLAESSTSEEYAGGGSPSAGVLGPDNIAVPNGTSSSNGEYKKNSQTRNNAVDKVTENRVAAPGAVKRLSVAVVVDVTAAKSLGENELSELVSAAAGIDPDRGDTVVVTQMPFDTTAAKQAKEDLAQADAEEERAQLFSTAKTAGLVLVVAILLLLAWRASRRTRRNEVTLAELSRLDTDVAANAIAGPDRRPELTSGTHDDTLAVEAAPTELPRLPAPVDHRMARREDISQIVSRQPEEIAQILRSWLAERRA